MLGLRSISRYLLSERREREDDGGDAVAQLPHLGGLEWLVGRAARQERLGRLPLPPLKQPQFLCGCVALRGGGGGGVGGGRGPGDGRRRDSGQRRGGYGRKRARGWPGRRVIPGVGRRATDALAVPLLSILSWARHRPPSDQVHLDGIRWLVVIVEHRPPRRLELRRARSLDGRALLHGTRAPCRRHRADRRGGEWGLSWCRRGGRGRGAGRITA
mmetsp:Transcript_17864/g.58417  ORF Transcript_17864/g.58417 Transcript_17864/m.58417 type:complete len:215 (+) Transcript_17864:245-889(+)